MQSLKDFLDVGSRGPVLGVEVLVDWETEVYVALFVAPAEFGDVNVSKDHLFIPCILQLCDFFDASTVYNQPIILSTRKDFGRLSGRVWRPGSWGGYCLVRPEFSVQVVE